MADFVSTSTDDHGVATLRVDRAPVNALNMQLWGELAAAAHQLTHDEAVRAVVVWGGPKVFAAGADIGDFAKMSFQDATATASILQEAFQGLARIPKVTIAAVNGYALGGGCELALTADFRYAGAGAKLGQPEILLGLIPGAGGTQRMARLVGVQKTKELVYGGGMVTAEEALAIGLVDKVVADEEVYEAAVADARRYAKGPFALRMAKAAIDEGVEMDLDSALRLETTLFTACFATEDRTIGIESFQANGPGSAEFVGR